MLFGGLMLCSRILCRCECGSFAQPVALWVTDDKSLLVTCFCINCEAQLSVIFPLSQLWKDCPQPKIDKKKLIKAVDEEISRITNEAGKPLVPPLAPKFELTPEDIFWEHAMGVKPDDSDFDESGKGAQ